MWVLMLYVQYSTVAVQCDGAWLFFRCFSILEYVQLRRSEQCPIVLWMCFDLWLETTNFGSQFRSFRPSFVQLFAVFSQFNKANLALLSSFIHVCGTNWFLFKWADFFIFLRGDIYVHFLLFLPRRYTNSIQSSHRTLLRYIAILIPPVKSCVEKICKICVKHAVPANTLWIIPFNLHIRLNMKWDLSPFAT